MKVLSFGIYSTRPEYPRHRNLLDGLKARGVEAHECQNPMTARHKERLKNARSLAGVFQYGLRLLASYLILAIKFIKSPEVDAIVVGYPGYFHARFVRLLMTFRNRKTLLIYDIFFSLYDALVHDRRMLNANSLIARFIHYIETDACRAADVCLVDTDTHGDYLSEEFKLPRERVKRVFVGPTFSVSPLPQNRPRTKKPFQVLFIGTYIPLHGVETILKVAKDLQNDRDITFLLGGTGQFRQKMEDRARKWSLANVEFKDWIDYSDIPEVLHSCNLALGVFGSTAKASRVIPIKVFDICAAGVPFVTADTPAIREVFTHGENAWLVPPGNPEALVEAILKLKNNEGLCEQISLGAYRLAETVFSVEEIGRELLRVIEVHRRRS